MEAGDGGTGLQRVEQISKGATTLVMDLAKAFEKVPLSVGNGPCTSS